MYKTKSLVNGKGSFLKISVLPFMVVFIASIFSGCGSVKFSSITPKTLTEHNKKLTKVLKLLKDNPNYAHRARMQPIQPKTKVFFMNAHFDEKKRAKAMFDYAIAAMKHYSLCYEDKNSRKCVEHPDVKIIDKGERASLSIKSIKNSFGKFTAPIAIRQFNRKYFPGFYLLNAEAPIKVINDMNIDNEYYDSGIYNDCYIEGYLEEHLKEQGNIIVDDPDKADYIILYQSLACNKRYIADQPKSLLNLLKEYKSTDKAFNTNGKDGFSPDGHMSLLNAYGYSKVLSGGFGTYFTPTFTSLAVVSFFTSSNLLVNGVTYEALIIDKKDESYIDTKKKATIRATYFANFLSDAANSVARKIVTEKSER